MWLRHTSRSHAADCCKCMLYLTLLANTGVLMEYRGTKLLLDGLFTGEGTPFSPPPESVMRRLLHGEEPFDSIDYLLISHDHPDHFSPAPVLEYLTRNAPRGIFLPAAIPQRCPELQELLLRRKLPCIPLTDSSGVFRLTEGITLRPIYTHHLDEAFQDVVHFCYLLSFRGKQVLFTADVDYTRDALPMLRDEPMAAVFMNPLFYHARHDPVHCQCVLRAECFCVYHVPSAGADSYGLRTMLERDITQRAPTEPPVMLMDRPMQTFCLPL